MILVEVIVKKLKIGFTIFQFKLVNYSNTSNKIQLWIKNVYQTATVKFKIRKKNIISCTTVLSIKN